MARAQDDSNSLRLSRRESERLIVALLLSLLVHLVVWAGYHTGHKLGWWQNWHPPAWLQPEAKKHPSPPQIAQETDPTIFVDVSHADADAPAKTKYYSNKNSLAANPEVAKANVPKIDGRQTDAPKTEDVAKPSHKTSESSPEKTKEAPQTADAPQPSKLQPSPPPPEPTPQAQADAPEPPQTPGETEMRKPKTSAQPVPPAPTSSPAPPARPRTLRQALAQRDQIPGVQMKQAGGVARRALKSSLDVKATPFGDYDAAIVEAVSQRWYDLLDNHRFAQDRSGKVTLRFKLKPDGSIIEVQTTENTVGEVLGYLCQEAIEEAAPFAKWPPDMARMIGANYRDITFTFYYY
jgi:hypothetical protein